jgi:hypothetical protein
LDVEYCPALQAVQLPAPAVEYVPALQAVQNAAPDREKEPGAQAAHAADPGLNCPALQAVQVVAEVDPAGHDFPAAHPEQELAPALEYSPVGHSDIVALVDPATQKYPALQLPLHTAVAKTAVEPKRPGGQRLHAPALPRLYRPALQGSTVGEVEPAGHAYPAVQFPMQDEEPVVEEYRPAAQFVHVAEPLGLNVPAGHTLQLVPLGEKRPARQSTHLSKMKKS